MSPSFFDDPSYGDRLANGRTSSPSSPTNSTGRSVIGEPVSVGLREISQSLRRIALLAPLVVVPLAAAALGSIEIGLICSIGYAIWLARRSLEMWRATGLATDPRAVRFGGTVAPPIGNAAVDREVARVVGTREHTALHEAAHLVVSIAVGFRPTNAGIRPDHTGYVTVSDPTTHDNFYMHAVVAMAGLVVTDYAIAGSWRELTSDERSAVDGQLERIDGDITKLVTFRDTGVIDMTILRDQTCELVHALWAEIEATADLLVEKATLSDSDLDHVRQLVRDAIDR